MYRVSVFLKNGEAFQKKYPKFEDTGIALMLFESETAWTVIPFASLEYYEVEIV